MSEPALLPDVVLPRPLGVPAALVTRACATVASGTSRFLVLDGGGLTDDEQRRRLVLNVMRGRGESMGLGDQRYQANKVVLVEPSVPGLGLPFRFYQVDQDGHVFADMACSNASPAAAVWARVWGRVQDQDVGDVVRLANLGTGQAVQLEPPPANWWQGDWGVRFEARGRLGPALTAGAEPFVIDADGQIVTGHIVKHGNVFVFAELSPERATVLLIARLAELGNEFQERHGLERSLTKVLPYRIDGLHENIVECSAACYSSRQRHHSLPGSAAMALSAFLTLHGRVQVVSEGKGGVATVRLTHPSGSMNVRVALHAGPDDRWHPVATSFSTPVRLLSYGFVAE